MMLRAVEISGESVDNRSALSDNLQWSTVPAGEQPKTVHRPDSLLMHPVVFIAAWVTLGTVFAIQDWINFKRWGYHIKASLLFASWGVEYLIWGALCWILWRLFWEFIQKATVRSILAKVVPFSVAVTIVKELLWVPIFPLLPIDRAPMPFWQRLNFHISAEFVNDIVVFWCAFLLFRGIGYYQKFRDNERVALSLEVQLANAQLSALRMQLNPHFLFNAMNSISSLMRSEVNAADEMLEQLSSLLRMSLERRNEQLITLREEIEFLEVYLSMQDHRYLGRLNRRMTIDPELHDAIVPTMILQPIVENAFVHGLSKIDKDGEIAIDAYKAGSQMVLTVTNSGIGLDSDSVDNNGTGIGIWNVRARLQLHYQDAASLAISELDHGRVKVTIKLPLTLSKSNSAETARYGVE
jgi:two-component system LytT family sensor kinase